MFVPTAVLFVKRAQKRRIEEEEEESKSCKSFFSSSLKLLPKKVKGGSCISASPICLRLLLSNIHPLDYYTKWNTISPRAPFTDYFHGGAFLTKAKSRKAFACRTMDHH